MSDLIFQTINNFLDKLFAAKNIWVGFSGGVDSHVLLYALTEMRKIYPELNIKAVHINHGILESANGWAEHCKCTCDNLNVDFKVINVNVKHIKGESLESIARNARYRAFSKLLFPQDIILVAHHLDDQAETCLLQFLRGSGMKGLASMNSVTNLSKGSLIRPFLSVTRKDILNYALDHKLKWIEDDSNTDQKFTRNFLRHNIIPLLKNRWKNVNKTIARVSEHCFETDQLLREIAEQDFIFAKGNVDNTLSVSKLRKLSKARQKNVLRFWLRKLNFPLPSTIKLEHILIDVIYAKSDAKPFVSWKNTEIRRYRDDIYALEPLLPFNSAMVLSWDFKCPLKLPQNLGTLVCIKEMGKGIKEIEKPLTVRFRCGGERCRLKYNSKSRSLKNLFQEWNIPTWKRNRIPLIFVEGKLAAILDYAICDEFAAKENETGLTINITNSNPALLY